MHAGVSIQGYASCRYLLEKVASVTIEEGVQLRTHCPGSCRFHGQRPFTHRPDASLTMCDHHGGDNSQVRGLLRCHRLRCLLNVILPSYEQRTSPFKETEAQNC